MQSLCNINSSPMKSCAKWLILSLVFVWLVGCAAMPGRKVAKKDPFQDKFSCGEQIPRGRAAAPGYKPAPGEAEMANRGMSSSQGYPAQGDPRYRNPDYPNQGYGTAAQNTAYANPAYANPAYSNPGSTGNAGYTNPGYVDPASNIPAYAIPGQGNPGLVSAPGRTSTGKRVAAARPVATNVDPFGPSGFERPEVNTATTRTVEAIPEFGMSPANSLPAESHATPVSYEIPARQEAVPEEAHTQGNWYDSDK